MTETLYILVQDNGGGHVVVLGVYDNVYQPQDEVDRRRAENPKPLYYVLERHLNQCYP